MQRRNNSNMSQQEKELSVNRKENRDTAPNKITIVLNSESLIYFVSGLLLGTGLYFSTMILPQVIWGFMSLQGLWEKPFSWDPSLLIVFASALGSHAILYNITVRIRKKALISGEEFCDQKNTSIDWRLILGGALFGIGWSVSGLCPGPAIVSSGRLDFTSSIYVTFFMFGIFLVSFFDAQGWKDPSGFFFHSNNIPFFVSCLCLLHIPNLLLLIKNPLHGIIPFSVQFPTWKDSWFFPLCGGLTIGISIYIFFLMLGRILGNSGMIKQMFVPDNSFSRKLNCFFWFLGMYLVGFIFTWIYPLPPPLFRPYWVHPIAGFISGIGTSLGNGCTSGHGICGISRFSKRSILNTVIFFCTCMAFTTALRAIPTGWKWNY